MTSDAGTGGALGPLLGGLFGATGSAAAAVGAQADMATELSSFTNFQKRVDDLIRDLKGSQAGPAKVGQEQLVRHQFGGGGGAWAEATGLYSAYESVISELETLSKLLSDSMEGMAIAVMASHKGYQNIDLDIRDRMAAISAETSKHYGGSYDPALPKKSHGGGGQGGTGGHDHAAQPSAGDTGGTI
ncbi:hypothetical protein [Streptomyces sp. NRRL S-340]|uniref:hypothetical protein n=1 Tax=Streptomyces sp. NRRL S-340 TaxID=1463901 RepID=UPI001F1D23EA|nr:hypothetical protein [Streptomyces sp. NRRL S-340]